MALDDILPIYCTRHEIDTHELAWRIEELYCLNLTSQHSKATTNYQNKRYEELVHKTGLAPSEIQQNLNIYNRYYNRKWNKIY